MQTCASGKLGAFFFLPGLGKEDEEKACWFAQEKFEKAEQEAICPQNVAEFPWCTFPVFFRAILTSHAGFGRIITLPFTLVGALCREGSVCWSVQKRMEREWEPFGLRNCH